MYRYERLTLQRSLELAGAVECPFCARTAFLECHANGGVTDALSASDVPLLSQAHHSETLKVLSSSVQPPPEYQHLARCAYCTYTFCNICKLPWHGREVCKFNFLYLKYKNGDAHTKAHLEASHGKELFEKLAEQEAANDMSLAWVHSQTKPCPRGHPVEKSGGCNKMVCSVCSIKFCWKCLKEIDGYEHFGKAGVCQLWVEDVMVANEHGWVRA